MTKFAAALLAPPLVAQSAPFGSPACSGPGLELADRAFFLVCYDSGHKVPAWTAHEIAPHRLLTATTHPRYFRQDTGARNTDYRGSGYSRGHMVPAEDFAWSDEALRSTYVLSNVAPQIQSVNAGVWRELEAAVRMIANRADATYVVTGPIFAGANVETIGEGHVAVPTHTFKVVLAIEDGNKSMYAAIVPNADSARGGTLEQFTTTVEEVERQTGLDFYRELEDEEEQSLESARREFHLAKYPDRARIRTPSLRARTSSR